MCKHNVVPPKDGRELRGFRSEFDGRTWNALFMFKDEKDPPAMMEGDDHDMDNMLDANDEHGFPKEYDGIPIDEDLKIDEDVVISNDDVTSINDVIFNDEDNSSIDEKDISKEKESSVEKDHVEGKRIFPL